MMHLGVIWKEVRQTQRLVIQSEMEMESRETAQSREGEIELLNVNAVKTLNGIEIFQKKLGIVFEVQEWTLLVRKKCM